MHSLQNKIEIKSTLHSKCLQMQAPCVLYLFSPLTLDDVMQGAKHKVEWKQMNPFPFTKSSRFLSLLFVLPPLLTISVCPPPPLAISLSGALSHLIRQGPIFNLSSFHGYCDTIIIYLCPSLSHSLFMSSCWLDLRRPS